MYVSLASGKCSAHIHHIPAGINKKNISDKSECSPNGNESFKKLCFVITPWLSVLSAARFHPQILSFFSISSCTPGMFLVSAPVNTSSHVMVSSRPRRISS